MKSLHGHGIGLRTNHYGHVLEHGLKADFIEVVSENFMNRGGRPNAVLHRARQDVPVILHGVSMSLGGVDPLNERYLKTLKELRHEIDAAWISDHICFGAVGGNYGHDLWPLPYTEEAITNIVQRITKVQDFLGEQIVIENVSSYVQYTASSLSEWDFISAILERADCYMLLDVNNVYVSSRNHGFDAYDYLNGIPVSRVKQLHLAGHLDCGTYLLDNHSTAVPECVWTLFRHVVRRFGHVPSIVEWDENTPELQVVLDQAELARSLESKLLPATPKPAAQEIQL
jgi:uncharacterized protein